VKDACGRQLRKKQYTARLFTLRRGVLPVLAMSSYCDGKVYLYIKWASNRLNISTGCRTTYHHNYSVTNASEPLAQRVYTMKIPVYLQVAEKSFVEVELINWFRSLLKEAYVSIILLMVLTNSVEQQFWQGYCSNI
jgi:hypothetical protein